jgi:hypothetical protein
MKDTAKVNKKNQSNVKHDTLPSKPHVTIVRPRHQEHKKNWIIRCINEKGEMIRSYEYEKLESAELVYKNLLSLQVDEEIKERLF